LEITIIHWIGFFLLLVIFLIIDLGLFKKREKSLTYKQALKWSGIWISTAVIFNLLVYYFLGKQKGLEFTTGYLLEYSLSVDNIFVFVLIFSFFKVSNKSQKKVLFWGIVGAIAMRLLLIAIGTSLANRFEWIFYFFGLILIFSAFKMILKKDGEFEPSKNIIVRAFRKFFPVTQDYHGDKFFILQNKKKYATPLFIVLLIIETSDLIFAFDSIPAIISITQDAFIIFTSNAFAILGLRSLYFVLVKVIDKFHYLKYGLALILAFIGVKMLIHNIVEIPIITSLLVIILILFISIIASLNRKNNNRNKNI
jgi:tellurite resistance protein TerC